MKPKYQELYGRLPVFLQDIAVSIYGISLYKKRYGPAYRNCMEQLSHEDFTDLKAQKNIQNERFLEILQYAADHSPFYKEYYKDVNLSDIKSVDDIGKLPILEKEMLRENAESINTIKKTEGIACYTGGTTGKALMVIGTHKDVQERMAYLHFWELQHGVTQKTRRATFNGRRFISRNRKNVYWRYNFIRRQMLYSTFDMTEENLPRYLKSLNQFKPVVMNGFVSAIFLLAQYINRHRCILTFTPSVIFTTSETLLGYQRKAIESAFHCKVRNQYASSEGAPFITECRQGKLHYNINTGVIEEYKTTYGTEMLVTGFHTHGTPIIRYRIGDKWEMSGETCTCGSCFPVVRHLEGRSVDYLYSPEHGKISLSQLADVIKGIPNSVINMQFVQKEPDRITVYAVLDEKRFRPDDESMIREKMRYRFGDAVRIDVRKVDRIEIEKNGKYSLIKNLIHEANTK